MLLSEVVGVVWFVCLDQGNQTSTCGCDIDSVQQVLGMFLKE